MKSTKRWALAAALLGSSAASCGRSGAADGLKLYGNIEMTQVDIAFKVPGRLIAVDLEEGGMVRKGAVLARLDTTQLESQRKREEAALAMAESQLSQLQTGIERQKVTVAGETDLRQAQLAQAQARLKELHAGSREQEIRQARAVVEEARSQHAQATQDWQRAQVLHRNDDISTAQFDQFRTRFEATAAALRRAEEMLALVTEGPRKETIEGASAQVEQAKAGLQLLDGLRLELRRMEQERQARQAQVAQARAQIAVVDAQLADAAVVSPIDGVVLVKSAESGEVLAAGTTIATIGDIEHPWLRAYVGETDLGRIKTGMSAGVTTDSFPGKTYAGRITFISSEAEFTPKQIQTPEERVKLVYRIKIEVENPAHELKLNMPVEATIALGERK